MESNLKSPIHPSRPAKKATDIIEQALLTGKLLLA